MLFLGATDFLQQRRPEWGKGAQAVSGAGGLSAEVLPATPRDRNTSDPKDALQTSSKGDGAMSEFSYRSVARYQLRYNFNSGPPDSITGAVVMEAELFVTMGTVSTCVPMPDSTTVGSSQWQGYLSCEVRNFG